MACIRSFQWPGCASSRVRSRACSSPDATGDPAVTAKLRTAVYLLFAILAILAAAYVYGVGTQWREMVARPVRACYFLSDLTVVFPLGLAAGVGLLGGRRWAAHLFLVVIGALVFDTAHQVYYL